MFKRPGPRAIQALQLASQGLDNPAIARELGVSVRTAKLDLRKIRMWMGARNTAHAVGIGYRSGVLSDRNRAWDGGTEATP
jgi:DNA-binding CsgD family transcriptional regulator